MKSNFLYTQMLKYSFLLVSILIASVGVKGFMIEDSMIINGNLTSLDIYDLLLFLSFSVVFFCLWYLLKDKVVQVKLGGQNLTILGEVDDVINWHEIESLKQLIFFHPPLYKLRIKNRNGYYLFITSPFAISFGFGTIDLSEMGSFLKRKRRELGL